MNVLYTRLKSIRIGVISEISTYDFSNYFLESQANQHFRDISEFFYWIPLK